MLRFSRLSCFLKFVYEVLGLIFILGEICFCLVRFLNIGVGSRVLDFEICGECRGIN